MMASSRWRLQAGFVVLFGATADASRGGAGEG
jgi:hypothetical protein